MSVKEQLRFIGSRFANFMREVIRQNEQYILSKYLLRLQH